MESYSVTIGPEELGFAAAHFITYETGGADRLHGHSYRVGITLSGPTNAAAYVCDFTALLRLARELIEPLDHRLLLAAASPRIRIEETETEFRVRVDERSYAVPRDDVTVVPVSNTTTEALAGYLADRLLERLPGIGVSRIDRLEVEVEEAPGISATATRTAVSPAE